MNKKILSLFNKIKRSYQFIRVYLKKTEKIKNFSKQITYSYIGFKGILLICSETFHIPIDPKISSYPVVATITIIFLNTIFLNIKEYKKGNLKMFFKKNNIPRFIGFFFLIIIPFYLDNSISSYVECGGYPSKIIERIPPEVKEKGKELGIKAVNIGIANETTRQITGIDVLEKIREASIEKINNINVEEIMDNMEETDKTLESSVKKIYIDETSKEITGIDVIQENEISKQDQNTKKKIN